ncbi:suppressor of Mek1 isoform X2 [Leptidea sinapis]|uniref:suppressor of Mek1 isoform X2 n=1 Tax=Leptidea sinapis TaxID=189913 RepID=UPI0021C2FFC4|nr:suppressor of Mek1 isoform X2 [Leptidea sinapis]
MKILMILLVVSGPKLIRSGSLQAAGNKPNIVEQQAKFFQDFFSVQLSPYKIEFGHVCEDPNSWEQRYEKKDYKNHRDMGKVRWGDKKGGYGEHYWDLNHAGHTDNHDNDYDNQNDNPTDDESDSYVEPSEQNENYETDTEKPAYENERSKRAYEKEKRNSKDKIRNEKSQPQTYKEDEDNRSEDSGPRKQNIKLRSGEEETPDRKTDEQREKNHIILVVKHKDRPQPVNKKQFVPYVNGAGIRHPPSNNKRDVNHRLFIEPSTGHVIDRATGKAYVLQPLM